MEEQTKRRGAEVERREADEQTHRAITTAIRNADNEYKKEKSKGANPDEARRIIKSGLIKQLARFDLQEDIRKNYLSDIEKELDSITTRNDPPIMEEIRKFEKELDANIASTGGYAIPIL